MGKRGSKEPETKVVSALPQSLLAWPTNRDHNDPREHALRSQDRVLGIKRRSVNLKRPSRPDRSPAWWLWFPHEFLPPTPRRLRLRCTIRSAPDGARRYLPVRPLGVEAVEWREEFDPADDFDLCSGRGRALAFSQRGLLRLLHPRGQVRCLGRTARSA